MSINKLVSYIEHLDNGSFAGWTVDAISGYKTALESIRRHIIASDPSLNEKLNKLVEDHFSEIVDLKRENEKLKAFKDYVHARLDEAGIEKSPNGEHSKHGCRIGDRLDIVFAENKRLREVLEEIVNPFKYMQIRAKKEGALINGMMAIQLEKDSTYLKSIASAALKPDSKQ